MKVLMITPYVTITSRPEFCRNKTGFGYMVYDIAKAVAKIEQVDVLCTDTRGDGFEMDGIHFLPRKASAIAASASRSLPLKAFTSLYNKYKMSKGAAARLAYYWVLSGYVRKVIKNGNYDVVHVHGCSFSGALWDAICKECNAKIVYTLHGLNSFSDTVSLEPAGKQFERDFLKDVVDGKHQISVISTGMKRTIMKCNGRLECQNISVVTNSFSYTDSCLRPVSDKGDIKLKYNIPQDSKIILYVGNISVNKNQQQLVRAFPLLDDELCKSTYVLFLGRYADNDSIIEQIKNTRWADHLILCGSVDKDLVPDYYKQADGVVLLSVAEGFGLSLIEGMHFGLPCMMPDDLDAFEDIYTIEAVVRISERKDKAVAEGLAELITRDWNHESIKDYSRKFESEAMAREYVKFYSK